jgi:hypothetical protein
MIQISTNIHTQTNNDDEMKNPERKNKTTRKRKPKL